MKPARESDGAPTLNKKLNGSSRSAIYANRKKKQPARLVHTHRPRVSSSKSTARGAKHITQVLST